MKPLPAIVSISGLGLLGLALLGNPAAGVALPPAPSVGAVADGGHKQLPPALPPALPPPMPPRVPTLGENLRALLDLAPELREHRLAGRSEKQREFLRARLAEFDALPPMDREVRLRLLELRSVLVPLLKTGPADRTALLTLVPLEHRELITAQLQSWDALSAERQQQILASESSWSFLPPISRRSQAASPAGAMPPAPPPPPPSSHRQQLEERLASWRSLSPEQRDRAVQQLDRFLALSEAKRQGVLAATPPSQREHLERLAQAFGRLAPRERQRCVAAFLEVAGMSEEKRSRFWQSADRWTAMSPEERSAWRAFTTRLPPQPPGLGTAEPPGTDRIRPSLHSATAQASR